MNKKMVKEMKKRIDEQSNQYNLLSIPLKGDIIIMYSSYKITVFQRTTTVGLRTAYCILLYAM